METREALMATLEPLMTTHGQLTNALMATKEALMVTKPLMATAVHIWSHHTRARTHLHA